MRYLVGVETPELKFFLKQRATHVGRVVQLAGPVVVEYLSEDARMSVEEILVQYRVVVRQCFGKTRQSGRLNLLERCFVSLVSDAADVDDHAVVCVSH